MNTTLKTTNSFFVLLLALAACALPLTASATANYVYHERTANNPGCGAGNYVNNLAPTPAQGVTVRFKVEYQNYTDNVRVYYTTDGSTPAGALGTGSGTTAVLTGAYGCTFTSGGVVDVASATIPAQSLGTTVKYIISAWHSGGGSEIFANSGEFSSPLTTSAQATNFQYTVTAPEIAVQQPAGTDLADGTASIGFGNQNVPVTSAATTFTITNTGTADLTGLVITKDGTNPRDFTVSALGATTLAPNASTTFTVTFTPGTVGARSAAIHITSNDSDENPFDIALTGTGVGTLYVPNYGANKIEKFNSTSGAYLGSLATISGPVNMAFDSAGNLYVTRSGTVDITKITPAGVSSAFVSSGLTNPKYLAFGSAGDLIVSDNGVFPGFIETIRKVTPGGVVSTFATVTAFGSPRGLAFDSAGNLFAAIGNTIRKFSSTGTDLGLFASVIGTGLAIDSADNLYVACISPNSIKKITPGGAVSTLATLAAYPLSLTLDSAGNIYLVNTGNTIRKYSSTGTDLGIFASIGTSGLNDIAFGPPVPEIAVQQPVNSNIADAGSKNFGSLYLGASANFTFTITNLGDAGLILTNITINGSHPGDFSVGTLGSTNLGAGASTIFTVTFAPAATGARTAAIHITNNDSDENPFDITLTGTGRSLVASNATYARAPGLTLKVRIADVAWDLNSLPLAVQSLGTSGQGATLSFNSTHFFYTPANNNNDSFTYTVTNGIDSATGTITVTVVTSPGGSAQTIVVSGGTATVRFFGIPGIQYDVQRTTSLTEPVDWTTLNGSALTPGADGSFSYTDESAPNGTAYYRSAQR